MMPPSLTMPILWAQIFLSEFLLGLHVFWNLSYQNFWVWSSASNLHDYNGKDCGCWVRFNDCRRAEMHVPRHWPLHWTTWMNGSVQVTSRHLYNCNRASIRSCKPVIDVYVAARMSMIDSSAASADEAQVAICDATNSTNERRDFLVCSCNFKDMRRLYPLNCCWFHVKVAKPGCDSRSFSGCRGKGYMGGGNIFSLRVSLQMKEFWSRTTDTRWCTALTTEIKTLRRQVACRIIIYTHHENNGTTLRVLPNVLTQRKQ